MANAGTHTFTFGPARLTALSEGQTPATFTTESLNERYPNAPPTEIATALATYGSEGVQTMNTLLIEAPAATILLDAGMGPAHTGEFGHTVANLRAVGIEPAAVDMVFITHFHGDHIMGLRDGDGSLTFPNARLLTNQLEWHHWQSANDFAQKDLIASLDFEFVMPGETLVPGVEAVALPGHTPGQCGLRITEGDTTFTHAADAAHHPAQVAYPGWHIKFDADGEQAVATRRALFERAAAAGGWLMFYHFPFPGMGKIQQEGEGFTFEAGRP